MFGLNVGFEWGRRGMVGVPEAASVKKKEEKVEVV